MEDLQEFERYMAHLSRGLGHSDRHAGLRQYSSLNDSNCLTDDHRLLGR